MCYYESRTSSTAFNAVNETISQVATSKSICTLPLVPILRAARWLSYKIYHLTDDFLLSKNNHSRLATSIWLYADPIHGLYNPNSESGTRPRILKILYALRRFIASDPRDHVFAIGGLLCQHNAAQGLPPPDYNRTIAEVLRDATLAVMDENRDLGHLECPPYDDAEVSVPSWVARWDVARDETVDPYPLSSLHKCDGKRSRVEYSQQSENLNELSVCGFRHGVVKVCLAAFGGSTPITASTMLDLLYCLESPTCDRISNCSDREASMALSLVRGVDLDLNTFDVKTAKSKFTAWCRYVKKNDRFPPLVTQIPASRSQNPEPDAIPYQEDDKYLELRAAAEYHDAIFKGCINNAIFMTEKGQLGVGPKSLQESDQIAVLFGCHWPVALRPLADADQYEVLGPCYIYGIMQGEAEEAHTASGRPDDVFHLL